MAAVGLRVAARACTALGQFDGIAKGARSAQLALGGGVILRERADAALFTDGLSVLNDTPFVD